MKKFITILLMALLCAALCVGAYAADEGFNASLNVEKNENFIALIIEDSSVLADKKPTLLLNCDESFDGALLFFDGKATELKYDSAKGGVTFTVAKGGFYHVVKNPPATETIDPSCTEDGSATYNFRGQNYALVLKAAGHDFSDTTKATCANCSEPNPDYVAPKPPVTPVIPSKPPVADEPEEEPEEEEKPVVEFEDVKSDAWYGEAVNFAAANGIMQGVGEDKFDPSGSATRAMIWTMLARLEGVDTEAGDTWHEAGQNWAIEKGISDGLNGSGPISREQIVTMIWRYAGEPKAEGGLEGYTDADKISSWAREAMAWAVESGLIQGIGNVLLSPETGATRAQIAQIFMNFISE